MEPSLSSPVPGRHACVEADTSLVNRGSAVHVTSGSNVVAAVCCELRLKCRLRLGLMPVLDWTGMAAATSHRTITFPVESDEIQVPGGGACVSLSSGRVNPDARLDGDR